jgi:glucan phosphoethanolaminetransferase (alkaline phosphatase superfamily)
MLPQLLSRHRQHWYLCCCLLCYLLILTAPALQLLYLQQPAATEILAISLAGCLFLIAVMPLRWFFLLLLPWLWLAPLESIHLQLYGKVSDLHLIGIAADTSLAEAGWFLNKWGWQLLLLWSACTLLALVGSQLAKQLQYRIRVNIRLLLALPLTLTLLLHILINHSTGMLTSSDADTNFRPHLSQAFSSIQQSFLPGSLLRLYDYQQQRQLLQHYRQQLQSFSFKAKRKTDDQAEVYLLVLGETSRMQNLQLNGYARPTTPRLNQQAGLVSLSNVVSPWSWTRMAVPTIVTRKPASNSQLYFAEPSLLTLFKQAGFQTYWFSVQSPVGFHDSPVSLYALEADQYKFINPTDYQSQGAYDGELLALLQQALANPGQKKFIVLHTLGSHYRYSDRYPVEFEVFQPSIRHSHLGLHDRQARELLVNSYDNSILYLDYVADQIIRQLQQTGVISAMWYISDHGEVLFDQDCPLSGHGHHSAYDHRPASFVWLSPQLQQRQPEAWQQLQQHSAAALTSSNVFDSLAALAQIEFPSARAELNIFAPTWQPQPRPLMNGADFDQSPTDALCQQRLKPPATRPPQVTLP